MKASSSFFNNISLAAKQLRNENYLMLIMQKDLLIKSMIPNGDCGYELICRWKAIHDLQRFGHLLPRRILEEIVSPEEIISMRQAIAAKQEEEI